MFTPLFRLYRQRRWTPLEREVRERYSDLLHHISSESLDPDTTNLTAEVLYEVLKRTRDTDLQTSLFMDFGRYITLQLDTREHLDVPGHPEQSQCRICLDTLDDCPAPMYHRTCGQWIAHPSCWKTWIQGNGSPQVGCECPFTPSTEIPTRISSSPRETVHFHVED